MKRSLLPRDIVDRQTQAYNARDIDAYCALYGADAVISTLNDGTEQARGIDGIRKYYIRRFENSPNLHCHIASRTELGCYVIDHEHITGLSDRVVEVVAIYEIRHGLIHSLRLLWE